MINMKPPIIRRCHGELDGVTRDRDETNGPAEDVASKLGAGFVGDLQQRAPSCRRQEVPQVDGEAGLARYASKRSQNPRCLGRGSC